MVTQTVTLTVRLPVNGPFSRSTETVPVNEFKSNLFPLTVTPTPNRFRFVSLTGTDLPSDNLLGSMLSLIHILTLPTIYSV